MRWNPRLPRGGGPVYRAIADALEADIKAGRLGAGDALPTQRDLAERLGVNFTTVTRAYAEARRRGLLDARVGSGTFVAGAPNGSAASTAAVPEETRDVDLSVNAPPVPAWMGGALRATIESVGADGDVVRQMLTYRTRRGDAMAREAGVAWLRGRGIDASAERVAVTGGAQHALALLLATLARPGDTVLVEALCYPGLEGSAASAGVRLVGVPVDEEGLRPDALDAACRRHGATLLCCVPTLQNPTTAVMSLARRQAIVDVARRRGLRVVEDDICGPLLQDAATPLAALAPDVVTYVGSLSKCVAPGLRTAFVLAPSRDDAARLDAAVRASVLMLSPLPLAVAASWVADGTAARAVADISREAAARGALARALLGAPNVSAPAGSIHAWLRLPSTWTVAGFVAEAQQQGIRVTPADWYVRPDGSARPAPVPNAVRLALGSAPDRAALERALRALAAILAHEPARRAPTL
ncbi:aminotransferase class I and II (plasmid) [Gemmatirosa kalamazoonensis]|uniref:Aminotransferase class I and II n=1 Tax=Gemmatirosa kalamazoonensis TaxID=861299 RepID=W0RRQ7_9BACT|nr:PLP-dependent aminotransferase family protein [Gemmatirosa kalamazoonensis]AHG93669.1 aminotransferase class I and II [Gemmatirosa kalamazoonensis]